MTGRGEPWHLDKKVPLGIIIALAIQTMALMAVGISWKTETDNRLEALEKTDSGRASHESRIIIMEQTGLFVRQSLERIEEKLDRIAP